MQSIVWCVRACVRSCVRAFVRACVRACVRLCVRVCVSCRVAFGHSYSLSRLVGVTYALIWIVTVYILSLGGVLVVIFSARSTNVYYCNMLCY